MDVYVGDNQFILDELKKVVDRREYCNKKEIFDFLRYCYHLNTKKLCLPCSCVETIYYFFDRKIDFEDFDNYLHCLSYALPVLYIYKKFSEIINIMISVISKDIPEEILTFYLLSLVNDDLNFNIIQCDSSNFCNYIGKLHNKNNLEQILDLVKDKKANDLYAEIQNKSLFIIDQKSDHCDLNNSSNTILMIGKSTLTCEQIEKMCSIFDIDSSLIECAFSIDEINRYVVDNLYDNFRAVIIGPLPAEMKEDDVINNSVTKILNMSELPKNCYVCKELDVTSFKRAIKGLKL